MNGEVSGHRWRRIHRFKYCGGACQARRISAGAGWLLHHRGAEDAEKIRRKKVLFPRPFYHSLCFSVSLWFSWDLRLETWDIRHQTSRMVSPLTSQVSCLKSDFCCLTSQVSCLKSPFTSIYIMRCQISLWIGSNQRSPGYSLWSWSLLLVLLSIDRWTL